MGGSRENAVKRLFETASNPLRLQHRPVDALRTLNELEPRPESTMTVRCRYQYSSIVHRASMIHGNGGVMGAVVKVFMKTIIGETSGQKEFL
jgi:hypothetical protein